MSAEPPIAVTPVGNAAADALAEAGFLTARTLSEALPFLQLYDNQIVVIKYGGHAMGNEALGQEFARDVVLLKLLGLHPVIVHGGGPQIGRMLEKLGIKSRFEDGLRVTDEPTMEIVEMVLAGGINKALVRAINAAGGRAVGISGADAGLIQAEQVKRTRRDPESHIEQVVDLGFVGDPTRIDTTLLDELARSSAEFIPVVAPVGVGSDGRSYNINADTAAGAIAGALKAKRLLLLTDVAGLLDHDKKLVRQATCDEIQGYIDTKVATGGMIPKLETAMGAVRAGVEAAVILDGRKPHALLVELFTEHGAGTLIS
jgi:acetylglutamate kinase